MNEKAKILVADDNEEIREVLRILLESEGFDVIEAVDGNEAVEKISENPDLIILDVMMPNKNGFRACIEIREKSIAPILFLTAKTEDSDKTMGFSTGGDDYLVKPFSYTEIISRVKALLRRCYVYQASDTSEKQQKKENNLIEIGKMIIDKDKSRVTINSREIDLTDIEYNILLLLASNRKKVFSAENIYESVWNAEYFYTASNTIMVHIRKLRTKIEENPQNPEYIKTVWGRGYKIGRAHV